MPSASVHPQPRRAPREVLIPLLFLGICLAAYGNALGAPFMMDDMGLIVENRAMGDAGFLQWDVLTGRHGYRAGHQYPYFRPLSHGLNYASNRLFGDDPFGYHLTNLLLLYLAGTALFSLLKDLFDDTFFAFTAAAIYLAHPMNVVIVDYITATGYGLLILAIILSLRWHHLSLRGHRNRPLFMTLSLIAFGVALLCHETAASLPLALAALLRIVERLPRRRVLLRTIPYGIVLGLYLQLRLHYASLVDSVFSQIPRFGLSVTTYIASLAHLVGYYLQGLVFGRDIVLLRAAPPNPAPVLIWNMIFWAGLTIAIVLIVRRTGGPRVALGLAWMLTGTAPLTLACFSRYAQGFLLEPHWLLLATAGFCLIPAAVAASLNSAGKRRPAVALSALLIAAAVLGTHASNALWTDEKAHCLRMLRLSPRMPLPAWWLGYAYLEEKDYDRAEVYLRRSLIHAPRDWQVYVNLGFIAQARGRPDEALRYFETAWRRFSGAAVAYYNAAVIHRSRGRDDLAEPLLRKALQRDPYLLEARIALADILRRRGGLSEARRLLEDNLRVAPDDLHSRAFLKSLDQQATP